MDSSSSSSSDDPRILEWELGLPSAVDLTPLSQTLISPVLAAAFSIPSLSFSPSDLDSAAAAPSQLSYAIVDLFGSDDGNADPLPAKRHRLVWTPQLHRRFLDAVAHLGVKNAVPKAIVEMMNVEGLTRENVASHLQKYRLFVKRATNLDPDPDPDPNLVTTSPAEFHNFGRYDAYNRN